MASGRILRVDMTNLKVVVEDSPPEYEWLGGRGLTARVLNREVPPTCHPLGKYNELIFAPGLLAGSHFPSCDADTPRAVFIGPAAGTGRRSRRGCGCRWAGRHR